MKGIIIRWILNAVALLMTASLIQGMEVNGFFAALVAAMVLGIVNAVIRPLAILLTLPINILTLGLFTLVINAFMLKIVSGVVEGFQVHGFWSTLIGALVLSILSSILSMFVKK